jgi:two-component system phosphate regulon sensor histidine kinase PhoR
VLKQKAIIEREAAFDRTINNALVSLSEDIEQQENTMLIEEKFDFNPVLIKSSDDDVFIITQSEENEDGSQHFEYSFVFSDSSEVHEAKGESLVTTHSISDSINTIVRKRYRTKIVDERRDDWIDNLTERIVMVNDSVNVEVKIDLDNEIERVESKLEALENTFNRLVVEVGSNKWNVFNNLDRPELDKIIKNNLLSHGINLEYEYQVSEQSDSVILASNNFDSSFNNIYTTEFSSDPLAENKQLISIYFPRKQELVLKSMSFMLIASFALTLMIIIAVAYNIFVIIKQKKLSDITGDFINNMTHEFKTPIATISLAVDSINNPKVISSEQQIRYFTNIIKKENKRMNSQVENILQMSLISSNDFELKKEKTDVHMILQQAVEHIELQIKQRKGNIEIELNAKKHFAFIDSTHIINCILNLLDNAIKYSKGAPQIKVSTIDSVNGICISIIDNGIGMKKEQLDKIFDRLYRIPTGNVHNVKGFGLGLAYVKAIIDSHEGSINVSSIPEKGSKFTICLKS